MTDNNYDYDIVFCTLPPLGVDRIYSAPPILKAVVQSDGYRAKCFDFVIDLFNFCNRDFDLLSKLNRYFIANGVELSAEEQSILEKFYTHVINTLIESNSQYFGFSVFSIFTHRCATELVLRLNKLGRGSQIVLGGRGVSIEPYLTIIDYLNITDDEFKLELGDILINRNLVKGVIKGDGEEAILNFLKDQKIENIQHRLSHLKTFYPDYHDYDASQYVWNHGAPRMDVTGSTGCVRNCDFCDVRKQFGKFNYKAGAELAEELIYNQKTYGVNDFLFTDSLVNGGVKPFTEFITKLAEYNATAETKITWAGMFICREETSRRNPDEYYRLLKNSGASGLTIGAESGSNRVLQAIDKKTTVEALFYDLKNFRDRGITCMMLTFVGHWSERHEDFIDQCRMLIKFIPYIRSGTIVGLELGSTFKLIRGTPAFNDITIIRDLKSYDNWTARVNRGNTFKTRAQRRLVISKLVTKLNGMGTVFEETMWLANTIDIINADRSTLNNFFEKHAKNDHSQFDAIANADEFVNKVIDYKDTIDIELLIEAQSFNGDPELMVSIDNHVLFHDTLSAGTHRLNLTTDRRQFDSGGRLELSLTNKAINDTEVDTQGNIVNDKAIIFNKIIIDDCDLLQDVDFFREYFYYKSTNSSASVAGLWQNDSLCLDFKLPFVWWFGNNGKHNLISSATEMFELQFNGNRDLIDLQNELEEKIKTLTI